MKIKLAKIKISLLMTVAAIALLMTGLGSGTFAGEEDTQAKGRNKVDQATRSWFETLSWEERKELLFNLQSETESASCQKQLIIKVYNQDSELITEFAAYEETPIRDQALRTLLNRSYFLMSVENEMYFILFD